MPHEERLWGVKGRNACAVEHFLSALCQLCEGRGECYQGKEGGAREEAAMFLVGPALSGWQSLTLQQCSDPCHWFMQSLRAVKSTVLRARRAEV